MSFVILPCAQPCKVQLDKNFLCSDRTCMGPVPYSHCPTVTETGFTRP